MSNPFTKTTASPNTEAATAAAAAATAVAAATAATQRLLQMNPPMPSLQLHGVTYVYA